MSERMSDAEFERGCAERRPDEFVREARRAREAEKRLRMGEDFLLANLANATASKAEMGDRLTRERDCAVARAKELEAALVRASRDFVAIAGFWSGVNIHGPSAPGALEATFRHALESSGRADLALRPPPPASASDRAGTR